MYMHNFIKGGEGGQVNRDICLSFKSAKHIVHSPKLSTKMLISSYS